MEDLIDFALQNDVDVYEEDTRKDILDRLSQSGIYYSEAQLAPDVKRHIYTFLPIGRIPLAPRQNRELWSQLLERDYQFKGSVTPYETYRDIHEAGFDVDYTDLFLFMFEVLFEHEAYKFGNWGDLNVGIFNFENIERELDNFLYTHPEADAESFEEWSEKYLPLIEKDLKGKESPLLINDNLVKVTVINETGYRHRNEYKLVKKENPNNYNDFLKVDKEFWNKYKGKMTIENPTGVTIRDLMTAYMFTKAYKFDRPGDEWYERVEKIEYEFKNIGRGKKELIVRVWFLYDPKGQLWKIK